MKIKRISATVLAGVGLALTIGSPSLGSCPSPTPTSTHAPTPTPETVSYMVTDDNGTALELGIEYRDNLDYELDALNRMNPAGTDTLCEQFTRHSPTDGYLLKWIECTDIPINEQPRTPEYS